jgi:hypothetical protein
MVKVSPILMPIPLSGGAPYFPKPVSGERLRMVDPLRNS